MSVEKSSRSFFDLRNQFIFYASYHNHPVNVIIHLVCIWQLLWTGLALFHFTPSIVATPDYVKNAHWLLENASLNFGAVITSIYLVSYILMDKVVGTFGGVLVVLLNLLTANLVASTPTLAGVALWKVLLGAHISLWILQFIGHGLFERRAPALLDSWDQAFITAPLFVLLEIFFFLGYRREFYESCMVEVRRNIEEFRKTKSS